jgi:hypothetical protein
MDDLALIAIAAVLLAYLVGADPRAQERISTVGEPRRRRNEASARVANAPESPRGPEQFSGAENWSELIANDVSTAMGGATPIADTIHGNSRILHASMSSGMESGGEIGVIDAVEVTQNGGHGFVTGRGL